MKILSERDQFLSNYEVFEHLKGLKFKYDWTFTPEDEEALKKKYENSKHKRYKRFTNCGLDLEVITRDMTEYFSRLSSSMITSKEGFKELMIYLNTFDLMKIEKLQIVNSLPRSMAHLYVLVEECDQRLDEEACEGILQKIGELFPSEEEEEEEEEGEEQQGDDEQEIAEEEGEEGQLEEQADATTEQ